MVGTGPGSPDHLTPKARQAIEKAHTIIGYQTYLEKLGNIIVPKKQEVISSTMMKEVDRCVQALDLAEQGKDVVLVCGGDPGIYAMAGLVFELAMERNTGVAIDIVPGIAALNSCAALLGAPLMHDFAVISLSDLLTPWEIIEQRLKAAAAADFVIVLYNPKSKKRTSQIVRAREIIMGYRDGKTPAGIVTGATRENEQVRLTTLQDMPDQEIGMQTTVIIGNSTTFIWRNKMITPRGYRAKYDLD